LSEKRFSIKESRQLEDTAPNCLDSEMSLST